MAKWNAILVNVEGSNYISELIRHWNQTIDKTLFDDIKKFIIEKWFDNMLSLVNVMV